MCKNGPFDRPVTGQRPDRVDVHVYLTIGPSVGSTKGIHEGDPTDGDHVLKKMWSLGEDQNDDYSFHVIYTHGGLRIRN